MRNMILLIKNNLKLLFRRKSNILFIILSITIPFVYLLFSFSNSGQLKIGIINKDNSSLSQDMIKSFQTTNKYKIITLKDDEINSVVAKGDVDCAFTIPEGYSRSLMSGNVPKLQIFSVKGQEVTSLIQNYLNLYIKNITDISKAASGNAKLFDKMYNEYKQGGFTLKTYSVKDKSATNMTTSRSLGLFLMFLMMGSGSTASLMLQEKREKTFNRICVAPLKPRIYIFSNFIVNAIITLSQVVLITIFLALFLKLPVDKSFLQLFLILVIFGLTSIGLSMLIIAFSDSTAQSSSLSTLIITPTCMLGGAFWPLELMPKALQRVSDIIPQKWAMDAISKIQEGTNFSGLLANICILAAFALAFLLIATYKIKITDKTGDFV
ncbi:MAG: ABC transporter permease [Clostridiales bacterium]|nr:ABC transporter permease [Clostridiales bacterium]